MSTDTMQVDIHILNGVGTVSSPHSSIQHEGGLEISQTTYPVKNIVNIMLVNNQGTLLQAGIEFIVGISNDIHTMLWTCYHMHFLSHDLKANKGGLAWS